MKGDDTVLDQTTETSTAAAPRRRPSQARFEAVEARRLIKPVLVTGVRTRTEIEVIPPEDFNKLNIDDSYQRVRQTAEVNQLASVLQQGGQIVDPIDVAVRPDSTWWIVDGQQRFWAHHVTHKPVKAHFHEVANRESEINLFYALNSRKRLSAHTVIKSWPGPAGDFVRRMADSDRSALRNTIDLTNNSKLPIDATAFVKATLVVLTGIENPSMDLTLKLLPRLDSALRQPGALVWAEAFAQLVAVVFGDQAGGRVRVLPMIALSRVAHRKFTAAGRPIFPKSAARLRKVNWNTLVPSHAHQYLGVLEKEIEKRWH